MYSFDTPEGPYVGQTIRPPAVRWAEHKKSGKAIVPGTTSVVARDLPREVLDDYEAFHIGKRDAFVQGKNRTRGNQRDAYELGRESGTDEMDVLLNGLFRELAMGKKHGLSMHDMLYDDDDDD